jgi:acetoin utilization protein AcuB
MEPYSLPNLPLPRGFVPFLDSYVRDIMTDQVISVSPDTLLLDAALLQRSNSIRHLPVVDDGRLVGLLSDRDIQRCAPSRLIPIDEDGYNNVFAGTTVSRVMQRHPVTATPGMSLITAIETMQQGRYGCLPVVDNDRIVGVVTRTDLLEAFQRMLEGKGVSRLVDAK